MYLWKYKAQKRHYMKIVNFWLNFLYNVYSHLPFFLALQGIAILDHAKFCTIQDGNAFKRQKEEATAEEGSHIHVKFGNCNFWGSYI